MVEWLIYLSNDTSSTQWDTAISESSADIKMRLVYLTEQMRHDKDIIDHSTISISKSTASLHYRSADNVV